MSAAIRCNHIALLDERYPHDPSKAFCPGCGRKVELIDGKWRIPDDPIADPVDHPPHYTAHPSGVECIQITEHMGFNLGNAVKYIWRADEKGNALEDLRKAAWYINRELQRRQAGRQ